MQACDLRKRLRPRQDSNLGARFRNTANPVHWVQYVHYVLSFVHYVHWVLLRPLNTRDEPRDETGDGDEGVSGPWGAIVTRSGVVPAGWSFVVAGDVCEGGSRCGGRLSSTDRTRGREAENEASAGFVVLDGQGAVVRLGDLACDR